MQDIKPRVSARYVEKQAMQRANLGLTQTQRDRIAKLINNAKVRLVLKVTSHAQV
jgi:hypothetical protein